MARALIVRSARPKPVTPVYETVPEVVLTLTFHEAQLIRAFAACVYSEEGDSGMSISQALRGLALPQTYVIDGEVRVRGHRPVGE